MKTKPVPTPGEKLRAARQRNKLSLRGLSKLCADRGKPVAHSFIQDLEQNRRNPSKETAATLAKVLDIKATTVLAYWGL